MADQKALYVKKQRKIVGPSSTHVLNLTHSHNNCSKKRLKALMQRPENQVCSDCPAAKPLWASLIVPPPGAPSNSLPIGAFCCLECSGSHRRLGVHISFVRSINLDSWTEKHVLAMENGGNARVNAVFEANLSSKKPGAHADMPTRERFIRDKYERRKFYDPAGFAAQPSGMSAQPPPALAAAPVGAPSDAARQRIEARRARAPPRRSNSTDSSGSTSSRGNRRSGTTRLHKPPKPAAPVDLLDFGAPAPAPVPQTLPAGDPFADFLGSHEKKQLPVYGRTHSNVEEQTPNKSQSTHPPPRNSESFNDDIISLYGRNNSGGGMNNNGLNNVGMAQMTHMMGNMNMMNNNNMMGGGMNMQQQQVMHQQQQMMMNGGMLGGGMPQQNFGGGAAPPMPVKQVSHTTHVTGHGFGNALMGSGPPISQLNMTNAPPPKTSPERETEDPFAQLARSRNNFR